MRGFRGVQGYTLIELGAALACCLPLLIGAVELFHILQTRAVLLEAARLTVRHLTTINGDGADTQPALHTRLYDWHLSTWREQGEEMKHSREKIASLVPESDVPAQCASPMPGQACQRKLAEVIPGTPAKRLFDLQKVIEKKAREEILAAIPQAKFDCFYHKAPYCVSISVTPSSLDGGPVPLEVSDAFDGTIDVSLKCVLPLFAFVEDIKGFGSRTYTVSAHASGQLESLHHEHGVFNRNDRCDKGKCG
jgi:hypothetical protein